MNSSAMEGAVHSHRDFRVRRSVVHRALNWLVTHNQYYRSNHVHIDVNALEQLPHDGNLSQLTAITVENASTEPPATNTPATGPPVGLDKLCQHNFENNRYSQEYENNAGIIGKAFCVIIT